jgi:uncharacterized membrane protein (DUF106 family)
MDVIDSDKMLRLQADVEEAQQRYREASERGDIPAMHNAAKDWQRTEAVATAYVLGHVEPWSDR